MRMNLALAATDRVAFVKIDIERLAREVDAEHHLNGQEHCPTA